MSLIQASMRRYQSAASTADYTFVSGDDIPVRRQIVDSFAKKGIVPNPKYLEVLSTWGDFGISKDGSEPTIGNFCRMDSLKTAFDIYQVHLGLWGECPDLGYDISRRFPFATVQSAMALCFDAKDSSRDAIERIEYDTGPSVSFDSIHGMLDCFSLLLERGADLRSDVPHEVFERTLTMFERAVVETNSASEYGTARSQRLSGP